MAKEHNSLADCFATLFVKQNMELCKKEREREEQEERKKDLRGDKRVHM